MKTLPWMNKKRFGGLREIVLERDNHRCQMCGMSDYVHKLTFKCSITIDHKDGQGRYSLTPNNSLENLWTLCKRCHGKKDRSRGRPFHLLPLISQAKILANLKK